LVISQLEELTIFRFAERVFLFGKGALELGAYIPIGLS
jgi:hypothetical protein